MHADHRLPAVSCEFFLPLFRQLMYWFRAISLDLSITGCQTEQHLAGLSDLLPTSATLHLVGGIWHFISYTRKQVNAVLTAKGRIAVTT